MSSSYQSELSFSILLKQKKENKKAPRPLNSFMIYRLEKQHLIFEKCPGINHRDVSKIIAKWWRELPEGEKRGYEAKAFAEKTKHAELYPNYKYRPKKKQTTRKYRKSKIPATALFTPERINALTELCNKKKSNATTITTDTSNTAADDDDAASTTTNTSLQRLPSIRNDTLLKGIIKSVDAGLDKRFRFPSIDIHDLLLDSNNNNSSNSSTSSSSVSSPTSSDMDCTDLISHIDRPEPALPPFIQFPKTPFPASSLF